MTELLTVEDLRCEFAMGSRLAARLFGREVPLLRAVNDISFRVAAGSAVGIVGESGCGKSTLANAIIGLVTPTAGRIRLDGTALTRQRDRRTQRRIQMVFQDPGASLNPKMTIGDALSEVLRFHDLRRGSDVGKRCHELLDLVELPASALEARPSALSGGQRQRAAIARSLALEPDLLIADEAVAALDVSVQAAILNLLNDLRERLGLTLLFISHDLGVVRQVTNRVLVLYLGRVVEDQPTDDFFTTPRHPYTQALLAAAPKLTARKAPGQSALSGEVPRATHIAVGCPFRGRCARAAPRCVQSAPVLSGPDGTHTAACHFAWSSA